LNSKLNIKTFPSKKNRIIPLNHNLLYFKPFILIIFYSFSFLIAHKIKYGNFEIVQKEVKYLAIFLVVILFTSLIAGKFRKRKNDESFISSSKILLNTFIVNLGLLILVVNSVSNLSTSRFLLTATLGIGFFFELMLIILTSDFAARTKDSSLFALSKKILLIEFSILIWLVIFTFTSDAISEYSLKQKLFFVTTIVIVWLINGTLNREFDTIENSNISRILWNHLKSYILFFLIVSALLFLFTLPTELIRIISYNIILFSLWSLAAITIYYIYKAPAQTDAVAFSLFNVTEFPEFFYKTSEQINMDVSLSHQISTKYHLLKNQLRNIYLKNFPDVYDFINSNLELNDLDISKCSIIRSADMYNIEVIPKNSLELYMNLHEMNDIRRINNYLIKVNEKLKKDGYFVGKFESNTLRYKRYHKQYPYYVANFIFFFDFLWKRVFPKLPFFKKLLVNSKQIYFLEQTRDTLLPKLLSGDIDVESIG